MTLTFDTATIRRLRDALPAGSEAASGQVAGRPGVLDGDGEVRVTPVTAILLEIATPHVVRSFSQANGAVVGQKDQVFCIGFVNQPDQPFD